MRTFGWIADEPEPPAPWDLRRRGWSLCSRCADQRGRSTSVLLVRNAASIIGTIAPAGRLIMLGVDDSSERERLLARGYGDALPTQIGLGELEARTLRVADRLEALPRLRRVGPLMLDLFHRDVRRGQAWLNLHPREFGVLWRLADQPGERVTRRDLLRDVWRIHHEPETNSVEVHVSRLRSKLAGVGCEALVRTANKGGYCLAPDTASPCDSD